MLFLLLDNLQRYHVFIPPVLYCADDLLTVSSNIGVEMTRKSFLQDDQNQHRTFFIRQFFLCLAELFHETPLQSSKRPLGLSQLFKYFIIWRKLFLQLLALLFKRFNFFS